jgi:hypothetical protein
MQDRFVVFFALALGLTIGSALMLYLNSQSRSVTFQAQEEQSHSTEFILTPYGTDSLKMKGWKSAGYRGFWLAEPSATLELPAQSTSSQEMSLILRGMIKIKGNHPDPPKILGSIRVLANGVDVGTWPIWGDVLYPERRFLIPRGRVEANSPFTIQFIQEHLQDKGLWRLSFGLISLKIENITELDGFSGNLDTCKHSVMTGWAMSGGLPMPVDVYIGGVLQSIIQTPVYRPDLKAAGLPPAAGFSIELRDPPAASTEVNVTYARHPDRSLAGSPCRF